MKPIETESATKLRGGYYTDPDIAGFLARWAAPAGSRVLEPCCGDGSFLGALASLSGRARQVLAVELDAGEAAKARSRLDGSSGAAGEVVVADFLAWFLGEGRPGSFDAVVGNPPYVRYQYLSEESQVCAEKIFERLRLPFTRHTNLWVPFVLAGLELLRPGGRLAMVVPAELLHVLHSQPLRDSLAQRCQRVLVIDPEEIWFERTLQGVVLLLAEKREDGSAHSEVGLLPVRGKEFLAEGAESCLRRAEWCESSALKGKWTFALLTRSERALLEAVQARAGVHRFLDVADVDVGIVTGANDFFLVADAEVKANGLEGFAHPMFGRSEHVQGVIYDDASHEENRRRGLPSNFLWIREPLEALPEPVRRYIRTGEEEGLHRRFKCRIREPWYSVPSVWASPVSMLKRSHDFPRLILNRAKAFTTDTAYRIRPKVDAASLVGSFLNSLTLLSVELEGRHYGGGVLELVPSEIERLLVPIAKTPPASLRALDKAVRSRGDPRALLRRQDDRTLGALGISTGEQEQLHGAWDRLRRRRQRSGADSEAASGLTPPRSPA